MLKEVRDSPFCEGKVIDKNSTITINYFTFSILHQKVMEWW